MDWPGLLKFSLKYSDGTSKSKFQQMSQDNKKWLQEALLHYSQSEVRRITQILTQISKPEQQTKEDQEKRVSLLEQLEQLIETLGQGDTLYALNGHFTIMKIMFRSKYTSNIIVASRIFCFANQNDAKVQTESINTGAFECLEKITSQKQLSVKQAMLSTLSSLVRGQNLEAKRILIRINGLQTLESTILKPLSNKMKDKANNLLRDLIYYDNHLHYTFNDLSSFTNTNALKGPKHHTNLEFDVNKQVKNNQLEENKKYQGWIGGWLKEHPEVAEKHQEWIKEQTH